MVKAFESCATESLGIDSLIAEGKTEEARRLATQRLRDNPADRYSQLSLLLLDGMAQGPWRIENQIENLQGLRDLNDGERQMVIRIYQLCYETAERENSEKKMWHYQRLLRHLLLRQTLSGVLPGSAPEATTVVDPLAGFSAEKGDERFKFEEDMFSSEAATQKRRSQTRPAIVLAGLLVGAGIGFWMTQPPNTGSVAEPLAASTQSTAKPIGVTQTAKFTQDASLENSHYELKESRAPVPSVAVGVEAPKAVPSFDSANAPTGSAKEIKNTVKQTDWIVSEKVQLPVAGPSSGSVVAEARRTPIARPLMPKPALPAKDLPETYLVGREVALSNEPHSSSQELRPLGPGTAVTVLETQGDWLKVKTRQDGLIGYVPKDAIAPEE